jgi:hypothetical protein
MLSKNFPTEFSGSILQGIRKQSEKLKPHIRHISSYTAVLLERLHYSKYGSMNDQIPFHQLHTHKLSRNTKPKI